MDYDLTKKVLAALERERVQYVPPSGKFHIDILTRLGELFDFASLASERVEFDGLTVSTVTPETLYRMKKGTLRPKDWAMPNGSLGASV